MTAAGYSRLLAAAAKGSLCKMAAMLKTSALHILYRQEWYNRVPAFPEI
jgi:hypothetical protein